MCDQVNLSAAKARLSELIDRAAKGEEIIIAKAGTPKARLVPLEREQGKRLFGGSEWKIWIADDFDDPLPDDILDAFEGKHD